jgi:RNA polymerase sigma factor (sigma-70 family)
LVSESQSAEKPKYEELRKNQTKEELVAAYEAYQRREPGSLDNLLVLAREFALTKVYHLEHDFREMGSYETADDWAQEVSISVWEGLVGANDTKQFVGDGAGFYAWVHKIAFNRGIKAFNDLKDEQKTKVSWTLKHGRGEDAYETDNPEVYINPIPDRLIDLPNGITGLDREIVLHVYAGRNYHEIGELLGMSESAVTSRIHQVKKRVVKEEAKRRARQAARDAEYARAAGRKSKADAA